MAKFDVKTVDLSGANLIEASAGTGKTFSIAVLVVRLIIEKSVPITKMLLVTFTEAAAAELKERSIKFIREAIEEFEKEGSSGNSILEEIVKGFKGDKDEAKGRLYTALLEIDQAMMCTIHSFCQQTLNEFAFETNQRYGNELLEDLGTISRKYINAYKREVLNVMDRRLLSLSGLNDDKIISTLVSNALSDKKLFGPRIEVLSYEDYEDKDAMIISEIDAYLESNLHKIKSKIDSWNDEDFSKRGAAVKIANDVTRLKGYLLANSSSYKFNKILNDEISYCIQLNNRRQGFKNYLQQNAIDWITTNIKEELLETNKFTFDDLIHQLHKVRLSDDLQSKLRAKYEVVFLDEFQDTDQKQYEIFYEIFQQDYSKALFYIGDPKQSIYGFRKADLNTYYRARNSISIHKRYDMEINFRSSEKYISALNTFFKPSAIFDTFANNSKDISKQILYTNVESKESKETEKALGIKFSEDYLHSLTFIESLSLKDSFQKNIQLLLDSKTTLNNKKINPSNICVITRSNKECKQIKRFLNELKVPSVISDDTKVMHSSEATDLGYILEAILNSKKSTIQKAMLTNIIGYTTNNLVGLNLDNYVESFTGYYKNWLVNGIYVAIYQLMSDFGVIEKHRKDALNGQRILSNTKQLLELLQEKEIHHSLTPNECYLFLKNGNNDNKDEEVKAYTQRIESDEDAVKIVTIHKSKGLEYDIVIAPFLDFKKRTVAKNKMYNLQLIKGETTDYVYMAGDVLKENNLLDDYLTQEEQENRRLLYVALTRAKFNSFVLYDKLVGSLSPFVKQLANQQNKEIVFIKENEFTLWEGCEVSIKVDTDQHLEKPIPSLTFPDANYKKMSYSFLAAHPSKGPKEQIGEYEEGSYDQFIFKDLPKGAHVGNLLHDIFEYIDYKDNSKWNEIIQMVVVRYLPAQKENQLFLDFIYTLIENTLQATIQIGEVSFQLSDLDRQYRRNEFEFNFAIPTDFNIADLENVLEDETRKIQTNHSQVKGMMNGFIDLFFELNGKFYILDWKSNFLGDHIDHYSNEGVLMAMNESNYHLQYLIYALALEKYLTSKKSDFNFDKHFGGVCYLFLRGVRMSESSGLYHQKVTSNELLQLKKALKLT